MVTIARIGIDTSKGSFQLHGVDAEEQVVLRKTLRRKQFLEYMAKQEVGEIGLEACGASHHWARALGQLGAVGAAGGRGHGGKFSSDGGLRGPRSHPERSEGSGGWCE